MKNYPKSLLGQSMTLVIAFVLIAFSQAKAGCNFGVTGKSYSGLSCTITLGQGNWGPRLYTWQFGDGTTGTSYSTPANTTAISHTFPGTGVYTMTITSQDSTGSGCVSWITDTVNITSASSPCNPQFSYWIDSTNCSVHIINQSAGGTSPTYDWVCWDGSGYYTITNSLNPVLTFSTTGNHYVSMYQNSGGTFCDSISQLILMTPACGGSNPAGSGCVASFYATHTSGSNCWQFHNQSSSSSGTPTYYWDFGDGTTSTSTNPAHCFTNSIALNQVVLYMNTGSCADSTSQAVIDSSLTGGGGTSGCTAQFYTWVDSSTCYVHFMNQSTNATTFQWYFFDGATTYTFTSYSPVMSFPTGTNWVSATLYTYNGGQFCDSVSHLTYMPLSCGGSNGGCNAHFTLINDSINTHTYYAYNSSTGSGLSYLWDFGDGTTSTLAYPTHNYATAGNYVVCLTVTGAGSCSSTYCDSNNVHKIASSHLMQQLIAKPAGATGVETFEKTTTSLKLYPNPAQREISLSSAEEISTVKVMDISGKIVLQQNNIGSMDHRLNISSLDAGSYFLEIATRSGSKAVKRFVKIAD